MAKNLAPMVPSEDDAATIAQLNDVWGEVVDTVVARLRSKQDDVLELATDLHGFYAFSRAMIPQLSRHSFPSTELARKLKRILPLLPRAYRPTATLQDLSTEELSRLTARISSKYQFVHSPTPRRRNTRSLRR